MKEITWYRIWLGLFLLSAGLGFVTGPEGLVKALMVLLAVGFFVPGAALLRLAGKTGCRKTARRVRNLALLSLGMTLVVLMLNFLSVTASRAMGDVMHALLVVVSAPMVCGQYWVMSLFFWGCLLTAGISLDRRLKKQGK